MSNANEPAYPVSTRFDNGDGRLGHQDGPHTFQYPGLTKREAFAMAAMQGIRANGVWLQRGEFYSAAVASQAVHDADALLAALQENSP